MHLPSKFSSVVLYCAILTIYMNSCKKDPTLPLLTTSNIEEITPNSAISGGNVTGDGDAEVMAKGICWNTSGNPAITDNKTSDGAGTGSYTSSLINLTPNTKYYVRAYATNSVGTKYGQELSFTTLAYLPTIDYVQISNITLNSATLNASVTYDGGSAVITRGFCWSNTKFYPEIIDTKTVEGSGAGAYSSTLTGLTEHTLYHVRAYATNSAGTMYSEVYALATMAQSHDINFNPDLTYGTILDIEGNSYKTIQAGSQTWMAENLRTTRFSDGTDIPLITDNSEWVTLTSPGYSWYYNDETSFKQTYGGLYNWYAVNSGKLCPAGWHVPSVNEWTTFTDLLGGIDAADTQIRETGGDHWLSPNNATNSSGFTALPGGVRFYNGQFSGFGIMFSVWSSTEFSSSGAWSYQWAHFGDGGFNGTGTSNYSEGSSVRCIKDN
jgi:uncharacterized protein (TIGR02145 family)